MVGSPGKPDVSDRMSMGPSCTVRQPAVPTPLLMIPCLITPPSISPPPSGESPPHAARQALEGSSRALWARQAVEGGSPALSQAGCRRHGASALGQASNKLPSLSEAQASTFVQRVSRGLLFAMGIVDLSRVAITQTVGKQNSYQTGRVVLSWEYTSGWSV